MNLFKRLYYAAHPTYTGHSHSYVTETEELPTGTKYMKYRTRVFRNVETGEDVELPCRREKVWIEWDDGTETTKYKYYHPR